jgi:cyclic pyranopterin phosphate synthase
MALDRFGRNIHYLRISLTDHCNLRCVYCMPEDQTFLPRAELMQDDEIRTLVQVCARLGFDKIRLTGGEPTVRANVAEIVHAIAHTPGIREVAMTTNGLLLKRLAEPLAAAGLGRVNISIDTLDPAKFKRITRWGEVEEVWDGILAATAAGLGPIKLNAVIVRGFNDEQDLVDLAELTRFQAWQVRFIEMMPFGGITEFQTSRVVTAGEMIARLEQRLGPLEPLDDGRLDGEARLYRLPGAPGTLGFINSVSQPFCAACTRARLTADGRLRLCLLRDKEVDLLTPLRAGASADELAQLVREGVWHKPWGHGLAQAEYATGRVMSAIGG